MEQPDLPGQSWESPVPPEVARVRERRDFVPVKCATCDREMDYDYFHNRSITGEEGTLYEGQPLCESCYSEDDAESTLRLFDAEHPDGEGDYGESIFEIGVCRNATADNGDIGLWKVRRERIDGWRSYVKVDPPEGWVSFHSDVALSGSLDSKELERFDLFVRRALVAKGVRLVRAVSITTNVFSQGVDYFVEEEHLKAADAVAGKLSAAFRDPVRFNLTAITGKDPKDADFGDHLLAVVGAITLGRKS